MFQFINDNLEKAFLSRSPKAELTGVELAKEIHVLRRDAPIIMCTGFSYQVDADTAGIAGIKSFAMKPLTKKEIAETIRKVLDE